MLCYFIILCINNYKNNKLLKLIINLKKNFYYTIFFFPFSESKI